MLTQVSERTILNEFTFEGVGLHTGKMCHVKVSPQPEGSGIRFFRSDLKTEIPFSPFQVTSTLRGTTLTGPHNSSIHTIEHFLAAVHGVKIDNLKVELDSEEMPILDGSALKFCHLFHLAGVQVQNAPTDPLRVTESIELNYGDIYLKAEPFEGLLLDVTIAFPYPGLEKQNKVFNLHDQEFEKELASARTFCFEDEIDSLRKQGLIKGGGLDCALVIGNTGLLNGPFRFEDEIVRHKTLDLLGDLMLVNRPLMGKITVVKAGHRYHVELAKAILQKFGKGISKSTSALREVPVLDILDIQKILPHRYPFLLVDRIIELEPNKRVVGLKNVTVNEPFFQGHFPGDPVMPGVLVIEAMAQVGGVALLAGTNGNKGKIMYLAGIDNARFRKPILPGDQIRFEVEVLYNRQKIAKFKGKALVNGQLSMEAEISCALVDRDQVKKEE